MNSKTGTSPKTSSKQERLTACNLQVAPAVKIGGTGALMREFLQVDDIAAASVQVMNLDKATYDASTQPMLSPINARTGEDTTIRQLAATRDKVIGDAAHIEFDPTRPDRARVLTLTAIRLLARQPAKAPDEEIVPVLPDDSVATFNGLGKGRCGIVAALAKDWRPEPGSKAATARLPAQLPQTTSANQPG